MIFLIPIFISESKEDLEDWRCTTPVKQTASSPRSPLKSTPGRRRTRTASTSCTTADEGPVVRSGKQTIYTAGRPPWYDSHGQLKEAFVIGGLNIKIIVYLV